MAARLNTLSASQVLRLGDKDAGFNVNAVASFQGLSDKTSASPPQVYQTYLVHIPDGQTALHRAAAAGRVRCTHPPKTSHIHTHTGKILHTYRLIYQ